MDIKIEIKEEVPCTDITSHIETQFVPKDFTAKMNDISERKCDTEVNIKEETLLDQDPLLILSQRETKMEIKEEELWLEKNSAEISSAYDLKVVADEHFLSIESPRSQIRTTSGTKSTLFLNECLEKDLIFNTRKAAPDCEIARKFKAQMNVTELPLIQSSVFPKHPHGRKRAYMNSVESNYLASSTNTSSYNSSKDSSYSSIMVREYLNGEYSQGYKCDGTEVSLAKANNLMHDSKKPPKCDANNMEIAKLARMMINKRLHKCDFCGKEFNRLSHVERHRLIHEGRKPHKCDICGKDFTQLSTLKTHKLIHEGRKPHKCDICGKNFTQLSHLKTHKLIHEGKRPHVCDICNKDFTQFITLKMHKLIHDEKKLHKCDICDRDFHQFSNLAKHIKMMHEGQK